MYFFATDSLSVFDPASPPADAIRSLFYLVLAVTGVIFVLVEGTLVYCIVRFRRREPADTREPPQIYGSQPIEVAWTLAPLLTVFVLFLVVLRTVVDIRRDEPPAGALQITVVGHQWWWEYRYQDADSAGEEIVAVNEMHIPVDVPVYLKLESVDVVHSFWLPRLAGKTDVIPGKTNRQWFQAKQEGLFHGWCAEFCGNQHANMMIRVTAEPREQFESWLARQKSPATDEPKAAEARTAFLALSCVNCHTVRGTSARGNFGPDLTHLMSRETLAASTLKNNRDTLSKWVRDPQQSRGPDGRFDPLKPGCNMPSLHLSDSEVERVVDYLMTLK